MFVHKVRNEFWKRWWKSHTAAAAWEVADPEAHGTVSVIPTRLV